MVRSNGLTVVLPSAGGVGETVGGFGVWAKARIALALAVRTSICVFIIKIRIRLRAEDRVRFIRVDKNAPERSAFNGVFQAEVGADPP